MGQLLTLFTPGLATALGLIVAWVSGDAYPMLNMLGLTLAALAGTIVALRLLDITFWHGWLTRDGRTAPPRILTDLFAAFVFIAVVMLLAGNLYGVPIAGLITTSGVLVAIIGFALRDMLASLFSGIALNIEHPFAIGDWIGLDTGDVGQVVEVSWLTTRLRTKEHIHIVVPNAELASRRFQNYGHKGQQFRDAFEIIIDHALPAERVERILLAAIRSAPEANATSRKPDVKIKGFKDNGIVWAVRFWLDDYDRLVDIRYSAQRAVLKHLHQAGVSLPYRIIDSYQSPMPQRHLDLHEHKEQVIARAEIFRHLSPGDLASLSSSAIERVVPANTVLTDEGDEDRSLFIVLEGNLDVTVASDGDQRLVVNQLAAGAFFGEFSLLTGAPRSARVETRSDCVLLEITSEALTPILQACPELADHLARVLSARQTMTKEARDRRLDPVQQDQKERQLLNKIKQLFGL